MLDDNISINGQPGYDNYDALTSVIYKGDILINEKRQTELNAVISSGEKILTLANYPIFQSKIERLKQIYFTSVGRYELANKAAEATIRLSDSLHQAELVAASNDLLTLSNQVRQEKTFRQLFTEKQQERIRLYVAIGLLLLFIFISFLLLLGFRNTRQLNLKLNQLNKDIQKKNNALELADAEKNRILTIVAHDLRSPMASIHALNNMLLNGMSESNPGYESHKIIEVASANAMEMADELLFVTNISKQKSELHLQRVKLNELISTSCALHRLKAKEKNQDILLSLPQETITATVDVVKISRAINNLLVNASKFSARGKSIKVTLAQTGQYATISVEDEGIGIDEQEQELIFEMFSKVRKRGTDGESTFGLGLSITKHIIEQHKGFITLKSKPGKGSTFTLHIPVQ